MILLEWEAERGWFLSSSKNGQNKTIKKTISCEIETISMFRATAEKSETRKTRNGDEKVSCLPICPQGKTLIERRSPQKDAKEEKKRPTSSKKKADTKKQFSSQMNLFFAFLQHWKTVWAHKRVRKLGFEKWKAESEQSTKKFIKKKKIFSAF